MALATLKAVALAWPAFFETAEIGQKPAEKCATYHAHDADGAEARILQLTVELRAQFAFASDGVFDLSSLELGCNRR